MAKISKWERLKVRMERTLEDFAGVPNLTAEDWGMLHAYKEVYMRMLAFEREEKKFDKA